MKYRVRLGMIAMLLIVCGLFFWQFVLKQPTASYDGILLFNGADTAETIIENGEKIPTVINCAQKNLTSVKTIVGNADLVKHTKDVVKCMEGSIETATADKEVMKEVIKNAEAAKEQEPLPQAPVKKVIIEEQVLEEPNIAIPETPVAVVDETPSNSYQALNYGEQRGFWITYLEYGSILKNRSQSSFKASVEQYFDNIASLGFNTVYVQVRAFGDAYYPSNYYPSGEQFNGTIGTENHFDALQIMIDCAHARNLSVHAWVNPMRLMTTAQLENLNDTYLIKQWYNSSTHRGTYLVESGGRWYLNPAYNEVTELIAAGITEIAANYAVDGIQIDDYFYPTTSTDFDSSAYSAMGQGMSLSSWRISNVNHMVRRLYEAVHSANSSIEFGISPQASVENNYQQLYADVNRWCTESGYCDYILPQVYFGFANASMPYAEVVSRWSSMLQGSSVKLVIGLAPYKIGTIDSYAGSGGQEEWVNSSDMLLRQISTAKSFSNYGGVAMFRYDSLFRPAESVAEQVRVEINNMRSVLQ